MTKKALITGLTGQDGSYLAELLLNKGYEVWGMVRRTATENTRNINHLLDQIQIVEADLLDSRSLVETVKKVMPDEVYNLASQSHVGTSFSQPIFTAEVTGVGALRLFDAVQLIKPDSKIYQASSSEQFGDAAESPQKESTPMRARSPYGAAKIFAHNAAKVYRESYDMFVSCGILFNHESPRRGELFVTQKIAKAAARIKVGKEKDLTLWDLKPRRDWGFAGDYVEAMWLMLQQDKPDDFVIATGENHTVKEFCELAFDHVGLNYKDYVKLDSSKARPAEVSVLIGDYSKARKVLGWKPKIGFKELVEMMVSAQLAEER